MSNSRPPKVPKPLNSTSLRDMALRYVGRYATSALKLRQYLMRKLRERGWDGCETPDVAALTAQFVALGYIDDAVYATQKAASLTARGYGKRRVEAAFYAAGIAEGDSADARQSVADARWQAALKYAAKRRYGPYARQAAERDLRQKHVQAMVRAGHGYSIASCIVFADNLAQVSDAMAADGAAADFDTGCGI